MDPHRLIRLGVFGAPQGVRGEVRVKAFTDNPKAIGAYGPLTDAAGQRRFALEAVRALKDDMVVARIAGIADREAAAALTHVELYARRGQLPPPDADEFYYDDLVGLAAVTTDGRAARSRGRSDQLRRRRSARNRPEAGGETLLFAFTKAVAVEIDFAGGRIVIDPPAEIDGA